MKTRTAPRPYYFARVALALALVATTKALSATEITWTGAVSNDWNNPANWNPRQVPTASDHVIISSGNVTVPANASFAVLDWTGGTMSGAVPVASNGVVNWSGGDMLSGSWLNVASNGVLNITGNADKYLLGNLTNAGTVIWSGSNVLHLATSAYPYPSGSIYNLAGGLFEIQNDQPLQAIWVFTNPRYPYWGYINNAGTLRKSGGSGTTSVHVQIDNTGTVELSTGTMALDAGGDLASTATASIQFSLGGSVPGSGHSRMVSTSPLALDGTMSVSTQNGFVPSAGDTFNVLSYLSATGEFTCFSGLDRGVGFSCCRSSAPPPFRWQPRLTPRTMINPSCSSRPHPLARG